jgi:hypothetical protein
MKDMGSLSKLTWSGERYRDDKANGMIDPPAVTLDTAMTEADFSNKHLGVSGAIILAAVLGCKTSRDSGVLACANLLGNSIGVEQAQVLLKIKEAKPSLTTLCGLTGDETELDLSGKNLTSGCAVLLAPEIEANGALASLDMDGNYIGDEQEATIKQICAGKSIELTH